MFREATAADLTALRDLEREADLAALGHVFPPDRFPFPADDVLARWSMVLDDPACVVLVAEDGTGLTVLAAYDDSTLRHLAVRPDRWGTGLGTAAVEAALRGLDRRGCVIASLWCLEENHRARRLYGHLGWRATEERRESPWPPHPTELHYSRPIQQSAR